MKGLVLAGGKGTRLRPLTHTSAKQLIPVANKPILFYGIEYLVNAGIKDIGVIVGHTADEIMAALGSGERWGCRIEYIPQDQPLGLAHAVKIAEPYLGDEPFVMYLGDNLLTGGISDFVRQFQDEQPNSLILLTEVPNPQQFGVAQLEGGKVVRLEEKPKQPKSNLALVGVYLFDPNIFYAVNKIKPSFRGELEITDAIQYLIENGYVVKPHLVKGWWKDTGKLEDLLEANRTLLLEMDRKIRGEVDECSCLDGKVIIEQGAKIINSTIRGPVIIGEDTIIKDSYIGPFTSIDRDCRIIGSEVEHSIVLSQSLIEDIPQRVENSLIGRNVRVRRVLSKPKAINLMLGDNSEVGIL